MPSPRRPGDGVRAEEGLGLAVGRRCPVFSLPLFCSGLSCLPRVHSTFSESAFPLNPPTMGDYVLPEKWSEDLKDENGEAMSKR